MFKRQKPIDQQVVVITGGTSGIGLETARLAGRKGARRHRGAQRRWTEEGVRRLDPGRHKGRDGRSRRRQARACRAHWRRRHRTLRTDRHLGEQRWADNLRPSQRGQRGGPARADGGQLLGNRAWIARRRAASAPEGGTIVNIGSIGSDFAFPLQGMYSASKHAIRGFTDALRMELEHDQTPITITLVKPASIDTPLPQRARNYMATEPHLPPPVYQPLEVARAIISAATSSHRDMYVGGGGQLISALATTAPRLFDLTATPVIMALQKRREAPRDPRGALHAVSNEERRGRGSHPGFVNPISFYDRARDLPLTAIVVAAAGVALVLSRRPRR
jgi:NAD(P)-dependent dehydrogenase (short-subunit alcohol dehydrogenase family)